MRQRVRFSKMGKIRFLSHRDVARVWERALRRAGVRVAYSEGFSPRPRLSFGLALSTGYESLGEYLDIDLADDVEPAELPAIVNPSLPQGMEAQAAIVIPPGTDSLQQAVTSSSWRLELPGTEPAHLEDAVEQALRLDELPITVERKGSQTTLDARPAILELTVEERTLEAELATQPRSLRPAELLRALDPSWVLGRALRTHQWTSAPAASRSPSGTSAQARRRPRTRKRVRHEKGSPR
jgi:radical SAM-linked protein